MNTSPQKNIEVAALYFDGCVFLSDLISELENRS